MLSPSLSNHLILFFICLWSTTSWCQQKIEKPYTCGFPVYDMKVAQANYQASSQYFRCQPGEVIASVGASNGYIEVQISLWVDSLQWFLQDIDSVCLFEFPRVKQHFEKLSRKSISGSFSLVLGNYQETKLPTYTFDRILLSNVYHELSDRLLIMKDVFSKLKPGGVVVIMERMGSRRGQRHKDCGHLKLFEPDFIREMEAFSFRLLKKEANPQFPHLQFFTFEAIP
jgi:SAM-dependent methyltransferase